jgi:hypothetical protein
VKRALHGSIHRIEILSRHECGPDDVFMEFCNPDSAFSFLCTFVRDPFNMVTLRSVFTECLYCSNVSRFTDGEICQQLACLIAHGLVKLVLTGDRGLDMDTGWSRTRTASETAETTSTTQAGDEGQGVTTTERREYASEPADEEQTVETLPSLVPAGAAVAQATTMTMAAESGAPFCES